MILLLATQVRVQGQVNISLSPGIALKRYKKDSLSKATDTNYISYLYKKCLVVFCWFIVGMASYNIIFNDMFYIHIMITDEMCNVHLYWHYQTDLSLLSNVVCWYAYFLLSYKYELIVKLQT